MKDIIGIGNALVDMITILPDEEIVNKLGYPKGSMQLINRDESEKINKHIKNCKKIKATGGSASNTIHGLAKLGSRAGYIGKVGNDELGEFFTADFRNEGVELFLEESETPTGFSTAMVTPDSERTFATFLGAAAELSGTILDRALLSDYEIMHIEGYLVFNHLLIEQVIAKAKQNNLRISLDLASFNVVEANLEFLKKIIPGNIDILFANEEEAKAYTGKNPEQALEELAEVSNIAVVKIGAEGSIIKSKGQKVQASAIRVKAIDTTGAGDQYAAGFLYGLIKKQSLQKCGEIGSLLAANVIEEYGARIKEDRWPGILKKVSEIMA